MSEANSKQDLEQGKGEAFFKRAEEVADTGNWDFAIEMYLEGISRDPGDLERGHKPLRAAALKRKAQGGKGPGMVESFKRRPGKDPLTNLVNAEYLLAKEPGSVAFMERALKAAKALELTEVVEWLCDVIFETQRQAKKPSKRVLVLLTETFDEIEAYEKAIQSCEMARQLSPNDLVLAQALNDLSAKYTIQKGKYDQEGDFTRAVKDMKRQKELIDRDALVKTDEALEHEIESAREGYLASPTVHGKINAYVDALLQPEEDAYENEAINVLEKAYQDTGAYQFKMRLGDVRIRQMTREYRRLMAAGEKEAAARHARKQLEFELEEYADRAANYPTDLALKYELGRRQFLMGQYDEAIGAFQQAQRDPRRHLAALNYLGQAFSKKGLLREAAETYDRALRSEMAEQREKDLRYNLAAVLMETEQYQRARDEFSRVAQMDYNYKDVRQRLEEIDRKTKQEQAD
jgi:tetratricopeptide (TPR) repeat protein